MFIFEAENIEAVKKIIEEDIYYKEGVVSLHCYFLATTLESFISGIRNALSYFPS